MELLRRALQRSAWACACAWACALTGCLGTSPEQAARDALGPDTGRFGTGPEHRAGFPCLDCHGPDGSLEGRVIGPPGGLEFTLAGTVYAAASDRYGAQNVTVSIEDASGQKITARTNAGGNFYLTRGGGGSQAQSQGRGHVSVPWALDYPLSVSVQAGGEKQTMRGLIWREGSCAACHRDDASATSNGRIFVQGGAP